MYITAMVMNSEDLRSNRSKDLIIKDLDLIDPKKILDLVYQEGKSDAISKFKSQLLTLWQLCRPQILPVLFLHDCDREIQTPRSA